MVRLVVWDAHYDVAVMYEYIPSHLKSMLLLQVPVDIACGIIDSTMTRNDGASSGHISINDIHIGMVNKSSLIFVSFCNKFKWIDVKDIRGLIYWES